MEYKALTITGKGILQVLQSEVFIAPAFDPSKGDDPKPLNSFVGIWDTGASASLITQRVVDKCDLKPVGIAQVYTAKGKHLTERYLINLMLPLNVGFKNVMVTLGDLTPGIDVLIGMDIITTGDFTITNLDGKTVCSFRHPSMTKIDFVQSINALNEAKKRKEKLDAYGECPCGSGQKYRFCCGKKS